MKEKSKTQVQVGSHARILEFEYFQSGSPLRSIPTALAYMPYNFFFSFFILQVANLVGYVIGPSGINWFISQFLQKEGMRHLSYPFLFHVLRCMQMQSWCNLNFYRTSNSGRHVYNILCWNKGKSYDISKHWVSG